jgi:hypothetical protein
MATSKTGSFWLTESVPLVAAQGDGSRDTGTIDLGAYVDVGDQQALAIEQVDFIWQNGTNYDSNPEGMLAANGSLGVQLSDLNPGAVFVRADDNNLIASGHLNIDIANNITSSDSDFYPDNFGKLDESRIVVNDQLYLVCGNDGAAIGAATVYNTVRIKARIVKLSTKDWMAIAIQSTASDN